MMLMEINMGNALECLDVWSDAVGVSIPFCVGSEWSVAPKALRLGCGPAAAQRLGCGSVEM